MDRFTELMQALCMMLLIVVVGFLLHSCSVMEHERSKMRIERDCQEKAK